MGLLGQSLSGSALTALFVCVSQAPANTSQTRHALEIGQEFSKLTMDRLRPMPAVPWAKLQRDSEACLAENGPSLAKPMAGKYVIRRQAMARDAMARLQVLEQLQR